MIGSFYESVFGFLMYVSGIEDWFIFYEVVCVFVEWFGGLFVFVLGVGYNVYIDVLV